MKTIRYTLAPVLALAAAAAASAAFGMDLVSVLAQGGLDVFGALLATGPLARLADQKQDHLAEHVKSELKRISDSVQSELGTTAELKQRLTEVEQLLVRSSDYSDDDHDAGLGLKANLRSVLEHESLARFKSEAVAKTDRIALATGIKAMVSFGEAGDSNNNAYPTQNARVVGAPATLRPLRLIDLLPVIPTESNLVEFVQITWTGGADVQIDEGAEKAEIAFDGELKTAKVSTIAVHTTVSAQVLMDNVALQQELERIMRHDVGAKFEEQLITGAGTTGRIEGLYTQAPAIASTLDPVAERIGDALQQMESAGYTPDVVMMNPADWFSISMTKNSDGDYIYGNPASPVQPALFNRPVVTSPSIPAGNALVGDTKQAPIRDRMQPSVLISRDHKDYATRNLVLILVELRAALTLLDAGAFRRVSLEPRS